MIILPYFERTNEFLRFCAFKLPHKSQQPSAVVYIIIGTNIRQQIWGIYSLRPIATCKLFYSNSAAQPGPVYVNCKGNNLVAPNGSSW